VDFKFKLLDQVILNNGQKGVIFTVPGYSIDSTPDKNGVPVYGVLYIDNKGFHYGPYDVDENGMELYVEETL